MTGTTTMLEFVAGRWARRRIGALAAAALAVGASPAAAQYGTDAPLPPLPPLQVAPRGAAAAPARTAAPATPARSTTANSATGNAPANANANANAPAAPADRSGVAGAVGSGQVVPADGTAGAIRDTGVDAPIVQVVSTERAEPVSLDGDLPFTGARIGLLAAIGAGLLMLGLGMRRRSPAAKP